jgi:hypothetical protein
MRCPSECEIGCDGKALIYRCVLEKSHRGKHGIGLKHGRVVSLLTWDEKTGAIIWTQKK